MTAQAILAELKPLGADGYKKIILKHGATEPCYGVKIEELKKIQKRIKVDYQLALDLYHTGVYDAMYLAGLIADDAKMTKKDLTRWVEKACEPLVGSTVAWVAAGSPHGKEIALEWIESKKPLVAAAGWATLGCLVALNAQLSTVELKQLCQRVAQAIHTAPNDIRPKMNLVVVSVGCYAASLTKFAMQLGEKIGPVTVDMGDTACQVPSIPDYIHKVEKRGTIGKKRQTVKC